MEVKYLDHMGSDLTVANAARVSFAKETKEFSDKDAKLISFLARHGHWTPFGHPQVSLHLKVPFFVAAQIKKHQVGLVVNEVSRRYVDSEPEFYKPEMWRKRADNAKQGSSGEQADLYPYAQEQPSYYATVSLMYNELLRSGVCPEQARMVLPLSTYTEFWMTGSLAAWSRMYNLRSKPDTQRETQEVASMVGNIINPLFPNSWAALTN